MENIDYIKMESFRGATQKLQLDFDHRKPVMMIYGENGTGKSTIVDAFSFICGKDFGSMKLRSGTKEEHICSICSSLDSLKIELKAGMKQWRATYKSKKALVVPDENTPTVRVLHRSQITLLVETQATKRYDEISRFIELPAIDRAEEKLNRVKIEIEQDYTIKETLYTKSESELLTHWESHNKPGHSAREWATGIVDKDLFEQKNLISDYDTIQSYICDLLKICSEYETKKNDLDKERIKILEAKEKESQEIAKVVTKDSDLQGLLQQTLKYLSRNQDQKKCPVCESPILHNELMNNIKLKIDSFSEVTAAKGLVESMQQSFEKSQHSLKEVCQKRSATCQTLLDKINSCKNSICNTYIVGLTSLIKDNVLPEQNDKVTDVLNNLNEYVRNQRGKSQEIVNQQQLIINILSNIDNNKADYEHDKLLAERLNQTLSIVILKRKEYVSGVIKEISEEVNRLYEEIHPDEKIGSLELYLLDTKKKSLELRSSFYGNDDIPPQSYYSESHLDTLGICINIALAKKYKTDILILDDVVTSVDSSHLGRFIDLLVNESRHFKNIIITTHYRPWKELYKYHQKANQNIQFVELKFWDINRGITVLSEKLSIAELEEQLVPEKFERQTVASKSGVILERLLTILCRKYSLALPYKTPPEYTLGELLSAFPGKFTKKMKVERLNNVNEVTDSCELHQFVQDIRESLFIRNMVGCHYNTIGVQFSDNDVLEFAKLTIAFAKAITCHESGEIPDRSKSGSFWESKTGMTRLYPLEA